MRLLLLLTSATSALLCVATAGANDYDTGKLMLGRYEYTIVKDGSADGTTVLEAWLTLAADGGQEYHLRDVSILEPVATEEALLRMNAATGAPLSSWLTGRFGDTHVRMDFAAAENRVTGNAYVRRGDEGAPWSHHPVSHEMPADTEWRGGVIWMAGALPLADNADFRLPWFATLSAKSTAVSLTVTGIRDVTVPAGTFKAWRIEQVGGQPGNVIWVDTATRAIVRVEVVGQPMTIDLVRHEAGTVTSAVGDTPE
jgi:hypothetical protein